jgi:hypothetical protein
MTKAAFLRCVLAVASILIATTGYAGLDTPTEESIAGLSPSGSATITEDYVAGLAGGRGTLYFNGQTYPFKSLGSIAGPGGGVDKITASGPVWKLTSIADFPGRYSQSTGPAGLSTSDGSDLWLQSGAGVGMHL